MLSVFSWPHFLLGTVFFFFFPLALPSSFGLFACLLALTHPPYPRPTSATPPP